MRNTAFYIALRYITAKKGSTAVTFITWLSALAMMVAVAAMFIILSVFSGLEELNNNIIKDLHADITIKSNSGKVLKNVQNVEKILQKEEKIAAFSKLIEEKVYIEHDGKGDIAYLRGVDENYLAVNPIHHSVIVGSYPSFNFENEVIIEYLLAHRLGLPTGLDTHISASIFMPKAGKGLVTQESDIFNKKEIYSTGAFEGKDQMNNFIIAPIELSQGLLQLNKGEAYQIVIRLHHPEFTDELRDALSDKLGKDFVLTTKKEENAAFWKMINIEKLFIYLIFSLVIFVTTFNLAGAIIILQLDKRKQAKTLLSLGMSFLDLRKIYFYTGVLIVLVGVVLGLMLGSIITFVQMQTGFFMASPVFPFPVKITLLNYLIVVSVALFFGIIIAWLFSRTKKLKI